MNGRMRTATALAVFFLFASAGVMFLRPVFQKTAAAREKNTPAPTPVFDQAAALAELRERIKGREQEPAETVFKNIRDFKDLPAGRLLAIMEMGYSRSLGVTCTHCHTPENWAADAKPAKLTAREMRAMTARINDELLKNVGGLKDRRPVINCTTCHRGELKPALNLPASGQPAQMKTEKPR